MIVPTVENENRELPRILLMAFTFGLVIKMHNGKG